MQLNDRFVTIGITFIFSFVAMFNTRVNTKMAVRSESVNKPVSTLQAMLEEFNAPTTLYSVHKSQAEAVLIL